MAKIGFMGAGKMAVALIQAMLEGGAVKKDEIVCYDPAAQRLDEIQEKLNLPVTTSNREVLQAADIVFLAFKPQNFPEAVAGLTSLVRPTQIIVSILAGVRIAKIKSVLPGKVIRVMPNTACLVGQMAAGLAAAEDVTAGELDQVKKLLDCAGVALTVTEEQLDAVTGLSGSGPAFVAYLIQAFIDGGVKAGLPESTARALALQTFSGTAQLLARWQIPPQELIAMVSSPNGTTVAGRSILESSGVAEVIARTIQRAAERSGELGK